MPMVALPSPKHDILTLTYFGSFAICLDQCKDVRQTDTTMVRLCNNEDYGVNYCENDFECEEIRLAT